MARSEISSSTIGAYIRSNGTVNNGYRLEWTTNTLRLVNANGNAVLGSTAFGYTPYKWQHVELRAIGNTIQVFVDGRPVLDFFSTTAPDSRGYEFSYDTLSTTTQTLPDYARERPYSSTMKSEGVKAQSFTDQGMRLNEKYPWSLNRQPISCCGIG